VKVAASLGPLSPIGCIDGGEGWGEGERRNLCKVPQERITWASPSVGCVRPIVMSSKPVFVYKLICAGTVEEKIQALQARKSELARAVLEGGTSQNVKLDEADLAELFGPLGKE
jgi:hypothetical protein